MGLHFGDLATIRGIITYKLSPHELKPLAGLFSRGLPNVIPRTAATIWTWLPPAIAGYLWYSYVEWAFHQSKRKNPNDYLNEINPNPPPPTKEQLRKMKCEEQKKKEKKDEEASKAAKKLT